MNWYKQSKSKTLPSFDSPKEFLKWMDNIDYGWLDKNYEEHEDADDDEFWENYSMLLPREVLKYKLGTCWDQTVFENYVFDKQFDFPHHMIFIQQLKVSTHSFLAYEKDNEWYWFEHAFEDYKGIHGPFDSVEDIVVEVFDKMEEFKGDSHGFEWTVMHPDDFKEKLTCKEFMDSCDYNYEEMEETDKESEKKKIPSSGKLDTQIFRDKKDPFKR